VFLSPVSIVATTVSWHETTNGNVSTFGQKKGAFGRTHNPSNLFRTRLSPLLKTVCARFPALRQQGHWTLNGRMCKNHLAADPEIEGGFYDQPLTGSSKHSAPEWRNWQTHQTQNLARGNSRGGSSPPSGILESMTYPSHPFTRLPVLSGG
jgi:hypothetical protein